MHALWRVSAFSGVAAPAGLRNPVAVVLYCIKMNQNEIYRRTRKSNVLDCQKVLRDF